MPAANASPGRRAIARRTWSIRCITDKRASFHKNDELSKSYGIISLFSQRERVVAKNIVKRVTTIANAIESRSNPARHDVAKGRKFVAFSLATCSNTLRIVCRIVMHVG
jgi:hypothetical protein